MISFCAILGGQPARGEIGGLRAMCEMKKPVLMCRNDLGIPAAPIHYIRAGSWAMKRFFALGLVVMLSTWSSLMESLRPGARQRDDERSV